MSEFRYLFGPVPSRRFGLSLGVDLVPLKTCSLDCIFCEVGRTDCLTLERREWAPTEEVISELDRWFGGGHVTDVVTLAGSGEPTLHTRFGDVIRFAKRRAGVPVVLLTNSTLMHLPEVRADAAEADIVKATLSAWDDASFASLQRPDAALSFEALFAGLETFRKQYAGRLWLEVFLVRGINDSPAAVRNIAMLANRLRADRIDLNTVVRPPAVSSAAAVPVGELMDFAGLFTPRAEVAGHSQTPDAGAPCGDPLRILAMLRRRPCTVEQIGKAFGMSRDAVEAALRQLAAAGTVHTQPREDGLYYLAR